MQEDKNKMEKNIDQIIEKSKEETRLLQLHSPLFFFKVIWVLAILLIILYRSFA